MKASSRRRLVRLRPSNGDRIDAVLVEVLRDGSPIVEADLTPDTEQSLRRSDETELDYVADGIEYSLITRFADSLPEAGKLRFAPTTILLRSQRRQWYRVLVNDGSEVRIGGRIRTIVDFGGSGIAFEMNPDEDGDLVSGHELGVIRICLPGQQVIEAAAVVRHVDSDARSGPDSRTGPGSAPGKTRRCGVELARIGDFDRDRLCRAVAAREREILGRRQHPRGAVPAGSIALVSRDTGRARVRRLLDIGSGGARFVMEPEADVDLVAGVRLPVIELRLRGLPSISVSASVARIRRDGGEVSIGVEFRDISAANRETLARYARSAAWGQLR